MTNDPEKLLLIIAGPNGSGKSSLVYTTELSIDLDKIINPDNFARGLSDEIKDPLERYRIAMDSCEVLRNTLLEQGKSFGFETVASREDKLEFARKAKSKGYYIDFIFVTAGTPEKCYERIQSRVKMGGHDVPKDKVFSRFERTMSFLPSYLELADHADVWDNSGDHLELICTKKDGKIELTP
ncbi:MAG: zeta toxin family protein, partial [Candidatus Methanomethylophilus sp.]|nr:zeta toxin family protein [Methanomethylophilus sp.]